MGVAGNAGRVGWLVAFNSLSFGDVGRSPRSVTLLSLYSGVGC